MFFSILKKIFLAVYILIVVAFFWITLACYQLFYASILKPYQKPVAIKIYPGSGIENLKEILEENNWLKHPKIFLFLARKLKYSRHLQYGEYWVKPHVSIMRLLRNIIHGKDRVRHDVVFIEGWTFQNILNSLNKNENLKHLCADKSPAAIMVLMKHANEKPEGLFFPATYYFFWGDSDIGILNASYDRMQKLVKNEWQKRAKNLPYSSPYEALIVASMIEKETAVVSEKNTIAGIILKRLHEKMRLQIDPTILYGLNKAYGSTISKSDLKSDTPYNTYRVLGLPPTPISMPGLSSIRAALHPEGNQYLFYVSKGDGSHQFSKTYDEHLGAVKKYREKIKTDIDESQYMGFPAASAENDTPPFLRLHSSEGYSFCPWSANFDPQSEKCAPTAKGCEGKTHSENLVIDRFKNNIAEQILRIRESKARTSPRFSKEGRSPTSHCRKNNPEIGCAAFLVGAYKTPERT